MRSNDRVISGSLAEIRFQTAFGLSGMCSIQGDRWGPGMEGEPETRKSGETHMKKTAAFLLLIALSGFSQDIRIACIGNSITAMGSSRYSADPDSYPVQLRYLLGEGYDIRNFGSIGKTLLKNGDEPYWTTVTFSDALEFQPDIVTIMLGTNDSKPFNWEPYKNEFEGDYKAMIDTFQNLPSNPQIYLCVPARVFENAYQIEDSNLVKINLIIRQIAAERNLPLIDCYTYFEDKPYLLTDGVHPNYNGLWEFAKLFYLAITGEEGPVTEVIHDINLVKGLPVSIEGIETFAAITQMTDRDYFTNYPVENGAVVELTLDNAAFFDMIQILLNGYYTFTCKVEASMDRISWTELGDETRSDSVSAVSLPFNAVNAQFLKITFSHEEPDFNVAEISVLQTAQVHAPAMTFVTEKITSKQFKYFIDIYAAVRGAQIRYCYKLNDGSFGGGTTYRADSSLQFRASVGTDAQKAYFTMAYANGIETISDTSYVKYLTTSVESREAEFPSQFHLHQNYPNPFNPSTVIDFDLNRPGHVRLVVIDCRGRFVQELVNTHQAAGSYRSQFDASGLSSGLYFYILESGEQKITGKMVLMH
jgi:lysophospholipase L1-like esterase